MEKRKRPKRWTSARSRYFPYPLSAQTVKAVPSMIDSLQKMLNELESVVFLDQMNITKQVVINAAIVHLKQIAEEKGAKHLARVLGPAIRELEVLVADQMAEIGKEIDPQYLPEGYGIKETE